MEETTGAKRSFGTFNTTVTVEQLETPIVKHIKFEFEPGKTMPFKAGQFVQIFVPNGDKIRRTSYSIASSPAMTNAFELCVTLVQGGVSSTFLHNLKVGDHVTAMGPLGHFTMPDPNASDAVFIATGSGIAPFRSMIHDMYARKTNRQIYLLYGNRYQPDIIYRKAWEELAQKQSNFHHRFVLSREEGWKDKGYVQDSIADFIPSPAEKNYYICGLVKMIDAVVEKLQGLGVPKERIHFERYD